MIISDLDHLKSTTKVDQINGSLANANLNFQTLALGATVSESTGSFEILATSSQGTNTAGLTGNFTSTAASATTL